MSFGVVAEFGQCMPLSFVTCLRTVGPRYWGSIVFFVCDCVCVCVRSFVCVCLVGFGFAGCRYIVCQPFSCILLGCVVVGNGLAWIALSDRVSREFAQMPDVRGATPIERLNMFGLQSEFFKSQVQFVGWGSQVSDSVVSRCSLPIFQFAEIVLHS